MRRLLTLICFFSLAAVSHADWTEFLHKEFPKTPWANRPKIEQTVCIDCHTSDLMKPDLRDIPAQWRTSWHYKNGVSCQDCHGGDPNDPAKSMTREAGFVGVPKPKEVPEFCGKCHLGIKENYLESAHGKALMATGRAPNCVLCHGSHKVQKASLEIINPKLCGLCHSYDRARTIKAALLLTEQKINTLDKDLKILKAGLIPTGDEEKTLFRTQAEYRTLFHTQDVNLVESKTADFNKSLAALSDQVRQGFRELAFRQNYSILIMLIFIGLAITVLLVSRKSS